MNDAEDSVNDAEGTSNGVETPAVLMFAAELRAWRQRLGWSQVEMGGKIGYSGQLVSNVERRERTPTLDFARACDRETGAPGTFERRHEDIGRESYPPWFLPFVQFEARAYRIHNWDMRCPPGLLQTEDYARAIIRACSPDVPDDVIERDAAARMKRQEIFTRERPPSCWFVIHEAALRIAFGGNSVMRAQMDNLLVLGKRPNVVIQVFPFSVPDCPGSDGPVTIFDLTDGPSVGYSEGYESGRIIEAPADVAKLVLLFDHIRAAALSPADSALL